MIALLAFSAGFFFLETVLFPTSWSAKIAQLAQLTSTAL
jgi:hypothetical protein